MAALEKIPVLNPLTLRNTVGGELVDIFEARGIKNFEELIGIKDLRSKEQLSNKALRKAAEILDDSNVCKYLADFRKSIWKKSHGMWLITIRQRKHIPS